MRPMTTKSDDKSAPEVAKLTVRAMLKQTQLGRMQRLASALLCASLGLLVVSVLYESIWPWLRWLQAFAEASAIGAIADWYAVVALFRRPLGLPIPHTAIIPKNKDSIGESLGEFVAQYLLTPENIVRKLERYDTAAQLTAWFATPANATTVAASLTSFVPGFLRAPEDADIRRFFQNNVAPKLLELDVARIVSKAMFPSAGRRRAGQGRRLEFDVLAAQRTGITGVLVKTGKYRPQAHRDASGSPDHVLDSIAEIGRASCRER